jgi:hypothetical protein
MRPPIDNINLCVTTHCQLRCPQCCCAIPWSKAEHHPWEYFAKAAEFLQGVSRIHLTGGEPTMHPQFFDFATGFRDLFGCESLTVETNGWGLSRFPELFGWFDVVYISEYGLDHYPGCPDNRGAIQEFEEFWSGKPDAPDIYHQPILHVDRSRRGHTVCLRGHTGTVSFWGGLLYPCCVAPGVDMARGIPLTRNWRKEIAGVKLPCGDCWFAGA